MKKVFGRIVSLLLTFSSFSIYTHAQVNAVEFGKNRVQYQKFNWRYYQTENFNTYFSQDGLELGKYVAQVAEQELPQLEEFVEFGLQRRINIALYNNFDEMQQSNIGMGIDWQNSGGVTKLVNNKMLLYFDANHNNLRRQVRQGIAGVLVQNILFGDDLGEMAANQTLLDLPKWLTDGYIAYAGETWSTNLDDQLKSALLSGRYNNFYQFAFEKPLLAGHAFWYYFGNKYGRSKTTYLLYLSRIYRNLNNASQKIAKKKFKSVLQDFMTEQSALYYKDIRGRRIVPKGQLAITEEIGKKDFIRFNANPLPRSFTYAVVEFKQGKYSVVLNENFVNRKVLLQYGVRTREDEINPNYPILAWDGKGTRLAVIYSEKGKLKLFVYDAVNRFRAVKQELTQFDQVQDMKYMLNSNTLILSAVKSGQTDIFVYNIEKGTAEQITNDIYDDLDASFVAFPNKTGIIFSSNRPSAQAVGSDTAAPSPHYNIFLVDNWNKSEFKQVSQLSNIKFGNARFPSQYNTSHFTFVSDESGINNRYAGFFTTEKAGLDTLVFIGDEILRNPPVAEVDSLLKEWSKTDIDSVGYFVTSNDSSYTFPLTNYGSGLLETRTAGDNTLVSEVTRQGDFKFLYRLRVDENTLRRRNITVRPTEYMRKIVTQSKVAGGIPMADDDGSDTAAASNPFQTEFSTEPKDSSQLGKVFESTQIGEETILQKAKVFAYQPPKFFNDYVVAGLNNTALAVNRFQPYANGSGPIKPSNGNDINGLVRVGTVDLFEDYKISGGFRLAPNLRDNDILFEATNLRKRIDLGFTYYRTSSQDYIDTINTALSQDDQLVKRISNYYLARINFAFDRVRSLRVRIGPRFDRDIFTAFTRGGQGVSTTELEKALITPDRRKTYGQLSLEYVHDNAISRTTNIWNGLRWKLYSDMFGQMGGGKITTKDRFLFNAGFDARYYLPIYRNIIWAVRGGGDFSWGRQKVVYYLGGVDGWLTPRSNQKDDGTYRYFDPNNQPDRSANYAYQALAVNLRGFTQNIANGNNSVVFNSEVRMPVFSTLLNRPINNALLRNFQLVQFLDLGTAWNGSPLNIKRPSSSYASPDGINNPVIVKLKAGGIGPLAGGYGFGARSTLLGYFVRFDAAWQMDGVFREKPKLYVALGMDF
ncbi:MAG: hypothetical protein WKF70_09370 [Chitinophagaceae bacterium]